MFHTVEQTAIISIQKCELLVFIMEAHSVLRELRIESLYKKRINFFFIVQYDGTGRRNMLQHVKLEGQYDTTGAVMHKHTVVMVFAS